LYIVKALQNLEQLVDDGRDIFVKFDGKLIVLDGELAVNGENLLEEGLRQRMTCLWIHIIIIHSKVC
jgi:hypothetical protein